MSIRTAASCSNSPRSCARRLKYSLNYSKQIDYIDYEEVHVKTRNMFAFALLALLGLSPLALANGLNLNSLGSRALSMGGAFVGLADD